MDATPSTTPRTATTATAENSPRQSEGFETVSSIDEQQSFLREADQEFQMLLQSLAEGVAELALLPEDLNQSRVLRDNNSKRAMPYAQDPFFANQLSPGFLPSGSSAFASSVVGGLDFDNLKLSFSQDLHTDMRLVLQHQQQHHGHNHHHHGHHPRRINTMSPLSAYEAHSSPASPVSHILPQHQLQGQLPPQQPQQQQARPEWQKLCIQHSVCIHNIYGNCAYGTNCYYYHLDNFHKPDLLFKTELCRYGVECANRPRCCFAHTKNERRTPEQNVRDALAKIRLPIHPPPHHHHHQQQQQQIVGGNGNGPMNMLQMQQQQQQQAVFPPLGMLSQQQQVPQQQQQVNVRQPIPIRSAHNPYQQQVQQQQQQVQQQQAQQLNNPTSSLLFGDLGIFTPHNQFQFTFQ